MFDTKSAAKAELPLGVGADAMSEMPRTKSEGSGEDGSRRLDVQGLRAAAVLMVVAFHAGLPVPGGFVGVDVFFVISGFVITAMLKREWDATGRIRFGKFYMRRFKRLIPALAVMVSATVVLSAFLLSVNGAQQKTAWTAIGAALFTANFAIANVTGGYFDAPAQTNPLLNTWSLSVEEQFYLAFPFLLFLSWRLAKAAGARRFGPLITVAVVGSISFALALYGSSESAAAESSWLAGFYSPLTRAWEFAVGAVLALALQGERRVVSRGMSAGFGIGGLALLAASLALISDQTPFPGLWTLLPVAGSMLLILAGGRSSNAVSQLFSSKPLVRVGDWSYSIYLWHWPLIVFASMIWRDSSWSAPAAAALAFPIAIASYYFVEQPFRNAAPSARRVTVRLVAVTVISPLVLAVAVGFGARSWYGNPELRSEMEAMEQINIGWDSPKCSSRVPVEVRNVQLCQWNAPGSGKPIYLAGDSNAMHFSDAIIAAGASLKRPVTALTSPGCPLVDVYLRRRGHPRVQKECRDYYTSMMTWLKRQPAGTVLIASVDRYWRDADYLVSNAAEDLDGAKPEHNAAAMNAGLKRTILELELAGHSITLVQTIPHFIGTNPLDQVRCSGWELLSKACRIPSATMPLQSANEWQSKSRLGIEHVAQETGASVLDLRSFFCPGQVCSTRHVSGTHLYMSDGYHLNRSGSALLKDEFVAYLSSER